MVNTLSIVIPVYLNSESISELIVGLSKVAQMASVNFNFNLEVVFVVDGSPDDSYAQLVQELPNAPFSSQLILHSRNFGSFAAIRTGLQVACGQYFCFISADLQEPPDLALLFLKKLITNEFEVVVGCRERRHDPYLSRLASGFFWIMYKKFIINDMPEKGVDVFGCNKIFRDQLLKLDESNSSLIGLIFWLGYRRGEVLYERHLRRWGRSTWTLKKKMKYLFDSIFSFTDLPIKLITLIGLFSLITSISLSLVVITAKVYSLIEVPGYATTVLLIIFFGGLNSLGLGIVGTYAWRAFENTKSRPLAVVMAKTQFNKTVV